MLLTVFTPTYNRKDLLKRAYRSLVNQSCHDFVWLVVDDGSTDGTGDVIKAFSDEAPFEVKYIYRENGGKMRAHNTGSMACETELFLCLDSDDELSHDAVQSIITIWEAGDEHHTGIVAYKGEMKADEISLFRGATFPKECVSAGEETLKGLYRKGFFGETTLVFRTKLLKKYPFPEIEGEKYVPEDYIYDKIDGEGKLVIAAKVFTVCELVEGGYTDQVKKLRKDNPTGWFLYYEQRCKMESWSVLKMKYICHYMRFANLLGRRMDIPFLWRVIAIPGYVALTLFDKR